MASFDVENPSDLDPMSMKHVGMMDGRLDAGGFEADFVSGEGSAGRLYRCIELRTISFCAIDIHFGLAPISALGQMRVPALLIPQDITAAALHYVTTSPLRSSRLETGWHRLTLLLYSIRLGSRV